MRCTPITWDEQRSSVAVTMKRQSKISGFFAKNNKRLLPQDEGDRRGELNPCDLDRPTAQQPHGTSDQPGGPKLLDLEAERWGRKFKSMLPDERPSSCAAALKVCDPHSFPNIHVLLRIACTLSVTSGEYKTSCSVLRRLSNYMRATMSQERLSALALRAVPEIILRGGALFFQTPLSPGHTWSQSPPTPRTRKCFN